MKRIFLPRTTEILINRHINGSHIDCDNCDFEHGPKTVSQALKNNDLTTSSGTVSVSITIASGEYSGYPANFHDGKLSVDHFWAMDYLDQYPDTYGWPPKYSHFAGRY